MLNLIMPEIFVTTMASIILLVDVFLHKYSKYLAYYLSLFALLGATILSAQIMPDITQNIFYDSFIVDKFACYLKIFLCLILTISFICARNYILVRNFFSGEFFALSLFSLLGMMCLISSGNFLTMYLGLELLVLPLYAMIVMVKSNAKYAEAAMKYFIIGSLGAGLLLYGISLVYGATGSFSFSVVGASSVMFNLGMLLIIVGLGIEFGAVPFHMWLPDVYEGSPTVVTMIIGTITKLAIFAMAYRLLTLAFVNLQPVWQQMFMLLSVLSLGLGNILAIAQRNLKRMLAYSTIGHVGFILLGLFAAPQAGYIAGLFYTVIYALMSLAAFAMILRLSNQGFEADQIDDFRGLNKTAPWTAFIMLLIMLSLAGIPPLVGFYAKLLILQAVINAGYVWLAALALFFSVIGAFYYLRVVKVMYFDQPRETAIVKTDLGTMSLVGKILVSANGLLLILAGVFPGIILYLCVKALT